MSLYNVIFTAFVPLIVGTMDIDVNREMSRKYPGTLHATAPYTSRSVASLFVTHPLASLYHPACDSQSAQVFM